jgi:hypothetical protein
MVKFENNEEWYIKMTNYVISTFWDICKYEIKNKKNISAIFLAGAPWSWKTEFLNTIFDELKKNFIVIDIDKYRELFKWYDWENSSQYQNASVKVADKILSYCFKNSLNFVFDWTFRNYNKIVQNFWQCKKYNRQALITLIYQEPRISFYYTFLRKLSKKRNVPIDVFIDGFYDSIFNVFKCIKNFNNIDLIIAHKKYNPLNKDKFNYKMDYKTDNLKVFCNKYWILYKKWEFKHKEKLRLDIIEYNDTLIAQFLWEWTWFWKLKIRFCEKSYKLF